MGRIAFLQKKIGTGVDEQGHFPAIGHFTDGADACCLRLDRMNAVAADHLIFEIDADGAVIHDLFDIGGDFLGLDGITALEIDRQRQRARHRNQHGGHRQQR